MNGRVYDPELGRFLSADPFVQDLTNLQAHNRYTDVLNNPLSLTDPTGFFFGAIFKAVAYVYKVQLDIIRKILKTPILGQLVQIGACSINAYVCVSFTLASTLITGGSLTDALHAAAITAASIYVYGEVGDFLGGVLEGVDDLATKIAVKGAAHGVVGGAFNVARGGSFQTGFIAGSVGAAAGVAVGETGLAKIPGEEGRYIRSAIVGLAGGTAAVATGGKFQNGFVTAAFAQLWNAERGGRGRNQDFRNFISKTFCTSDECVLLQVGIRARELHEGLLESSGQPAYDRRVTAVLAVYDPIGHVDLFSEPGIYYLVASSEPTLGAQRDALYVNEVEIIGESGVHAEIKLLDFVSNNPALSPIAIGIFRNSQTTGACPVCQDRLFEQGFSPVPVD